MAQIGTVIGFLMLASASSSVSRAATYYVTQSGSGNQNGTSLSNAWSIPQYNASPVPTGGDTVFFSGAISSSVTPNTGGTGNGASRLTLDFSGATLSTPAIGLSGGKNYLTFLGGTVTGNGSDVITCAYSGPGVGHDITISNFTYTGQAGGADTFFSVGSCSYVTISNNTVDNVLSFVNEWQGRTQNISILNNYARTSGNITQQSDLITLGDAQNVIIQGNKLINRSPGSQSNSRHNDVIQTFQSGATNNQAPSNWTIAYNWIEEGVTDCSNTDGSNSWTMIEGTGGTNYLYGNIFFASGPCYFGNGNTLDSNQPTTVWYVYNNTYASPSGYPGIWFQNSGHLYFRNNAFQMANSSGGGALIFNWTANATWDYNYFYGVPSCNVTITGAHGSCSTSPGFTNFPGGNVSLQAGSLLVSAGDDTIGAQYSQGIAPDATWPNPRVVTRIAGNWDVGAYQTGGALATLSPPSGLTAVVR